MQAGEEPVTATWEEARPPHLPDRITAIPVMVWPFVALTVVVVFARSRMYIGVPFDASIAVSFGLGMARLGAMTLLGAALFLRHPDAWSRLRPVAVAVSLIAIAEALDVFAPHVEGLVRGGSIGSGWDGESFPIITTSYVLGRVASVIGIVGIASLWSRPSRHPTNAGCHCTLVLFVALSIVALAFLALGYGRALDDGWGDADQAIAAAANRISLAILAVTLVAWVAVASILVVGAPRQERPTSGWAVGAIAALAIAVGLEPIYFLWPTFDADVRASRLPAGSLSGSRPPGPVLPPRRVPPRTPRTGRRGGANPDPPDMERPRHPIHMGAPVATPLGGATS